MQTWALYEQGNLENIVDAFLGNDLDMQEATRFLKVALLCTQDATKLRPSMSTVLKLLTGAKSIGSEKITKPAVISDFMDLKVKNTKENYNFGQVSTTICSSALATSAFSSEDDTTVLSVASSDKDFKWKSMLAGGPFGRISNKACKFCAYNLIEKSKELRILLFFILLFWGNW